MDFTTEEKLWLEEISSEICEDSELTPLEKLLRDMAKPKNELEGKLFELTACVKFGLAEPSSSLQISLSNPPLSQCG